MAYRLTSPLVAFVGSMYNAKPSKNILIIPYTCFDDITFRYGGHQFGSWSSQLGDGRAHLLGEYLNKKEKRWEIQLKGSGRTPYSRHGDGRAVLRSSLREFLCSEAMYHLGAPTSRAVSLVISDDPVIRDPFYNGTIIREKAAVVLRLAPSWFRFGSFEILAENNELDLMASLLDFVIDNYFNDSIFSTDVNRYEQFFSIVQNQTIEMIAKWMSVGFAHGVCNTDNFSILSLTIDYGPFGFVDAYDPNFIPNLSDETGMYALERQASVALFNLHKLYDALKLLFTVHQRREVRKILASFQSFYQARFLQEFKKKLGIEGSDQDDTTLIAALLHLMKDVGADFTMTFRQLSSLPFKDIASYAIPSHMWALNDLKEHELFRNWLKAYQERLLKNPSFDDNSRLLKMRLINPRYVLRTWMADVAIKKAEVGDFSEAWKLHMILQYPFEEHPLAEHSGYASRPPIWAKSLRVSCSS